MLRPEEIDMLVCGNPKLDMKELKKVTVYDGFHPNDPVIRYDGFYPCYSFILMIQQGMCSEFFHLRIILSGKLK